MAEDFIQECLSEGISNLSEIRKKAISSLEEINKTSNNLSIKKKDLLSIVNSRQKNNSTIIFGSTDYGSLSVQYKKIIDKIICLLDTEQRSVRNILDNISSDDHFLINDKDVLLAINYLCENNIISKNNKLLSKGSNWETFNAR